MFSKRNNREIGTNQRIVRPERDNQQKKARSQARSCSRKYMTKKRAPQKKQSTDIQSLQAHRRLVSLVGKVPVYRAGGPGSIPGQTNT